MIYVIVGVVVAIFYFIVGGRILYRLHHVSKATAKSKVVRRNTRLSRMTVLIVISGVSLLVFLFGLVVFLAAGFNSAIVCLAAWLYSFGLNGVAVCQTLIFETPGSASSGSNSDGKSKPQKGSNNSSQPTASKPSGTDEASDSSNSENEMK